MAGRVCPWWVGYILANPLRRFSQDPRKMLGDYLEPGMTVLDVGCAMGFFSLGVARMVGPKGRVIAVDLQERMIRSLKRRAARAGLSDRIDARVCRDHSLEIADLAGRVDFALALYVVHEVPDVPRFMAEIHEALRPGGRMFIVEPRGHASADEYGITENTVLQAGFTIEDHPKIRRSWATLFVRN